ncbi:hypothetical protein EYC84_008396 [Monilinia fructicola]|uniref:Uncharacterized protein n=1 Tax=Monilinia fructicola TaxID=38448 RepID=A0A5M9JLP9_MONFR|nr:hypothetical protein EYC84_008396 [Monilinia fructicola]
MILSEILQYYMRFDAMRCDAMRRSGTYAPGDDIFNFSILYSEIDWTGKTTYDPAKVTNALHTFISPLAQ